MSEIKKIAIKNYIYCFALEAFHYVCSEQKFKSKDIRKQFEDSILDEVHKGNANFTKYIGNAVRVSQIFFREYFMARYDIKSVSQSASDFANDFEVILLFWLSKRDNVFVKIIDSLALMTEAVLFCDSYRRFKLNLEEMIEWFIALFISNFESDFFKKGGWNSLNEKAFLWYHEIFEEYNIEGCFELGYKVFFKHDCDIMSLLKMSKVMFPLPNSWFCDKCIDYYNKQMKRRITYVKLDNAILKDMLEKSKKEIELGSDDKLEDTSIKKKNFNDDVVKATNSTPDFVFSGLYPSNSVIKSNQNLLDAFLGSITPSSISNEFCLISKQYSHSMGNLLKEVLPLQYKTLIAFSKEDSVIPVSKSELENLDTKLFKLTPFNYVYVGGFIKSAEKKQTNMSGTQLKLKTCKMSFFM